VWEAPCAVSVRDVNERLAKVRPVAVTTVATILDRLYRKGLVSRTLLRKGGPHYLYKPKLSEDEFRQALVHNVMGTLLRGFNEVTVAYLAEKMSISESDKRFVSKYLNRLREGNKK